MSRIARKLARAGHRVVLAYWVACARQDVLGQGLRVPAGVWRCVDCGRLEWDRDAFMLHRRVHGT